jgi:hypothetical protein
VQTLFISNTFDRSLYALNKLPAAGRRAPLAVSKTVQPTFLPTLSWSP